MQSSDLAARRSSQWSATQPSQSPLAAIQARGLCIHSDKRGLPASPTTSDATWRIVGSAANSGQQNRFFVASLFPSRWLLPLLLSALTAWASHTAVLELGSIAVNRTYPSPTLAAAHRRDEQRAAAAVDAQQDGRRNECTGEQRDKQAQQTSRGQSTVSSDGERSQLTRSLLVCLARCVCQNLRWCFGFNSSVANTVHSLTSSSRHALFYVSAHTGIIHDLHHDQQFLLQGHWSEPTRRAD